MSFEDNSFKEDTKMENLEIENLEVEEIQPLQVDSPRTTERSKLTRYLTRFVMIVFGIVLLICVTTLVTHYENER